MVNLRTDAEELAIALELGFASVEEAVVWADSMIVALEQPPYALIEVSSAGRSPASEVAHLLRGLPGEVDIQTASKRVITRMATALQRRDAAPEQVARALYSMQLDGLVPQAEAESEMIRLDDAFDLAHQRTYGTLEDVRRDLYEFLRRVSA